MHGVDTVPEKLRRNPFFRFSEETRFVPAWDKIRPCHVMPAFDYALTLARNNITKIRDNPARPAFKNTIEALETADELAGYFFLTLVNMMPRNRKDEDDYGRLVTDVARAYNIFYEDVYRDRDLFARVKAVRQNPGFHKLPKTKKLLFEAIYNGFCDSGMTLSAKKKQILRETDESIIALEALSQKNMKKADAETVVFSSERALDGLPPYALSAARKKAVEQGLSGRWAFTLHHDSYITFMQSVRDRRARRRMYLAYNRRAAQGRNDNRAVILDLSRLYQQKAQLLGYKSHADMQLRYRMALRPGTAGRFLRLVRDTALPLAAEENRELCAFARKECGIRTLQPWDVLYCTERLKEKTYGFNDEELRPYFALETVLAGTFRHFEKLYGLRFEETKDYPVYHRDVRAFNVTSKRSGAVVGVLFMDLYARDDKPAGIAWNASVFGQGLFGGKVRRPVDIIVTKFPRPSRRTPSLLTHGDVCTLFHEMGHATHDLLSRVRYRSQSGTNVDWDFVEFPSQIQENWAFEPYVLGGLAVHYKTGEPLPDRLKDKIWESRSFMAATQMLEGARKGWLDLAWAEAQPGTVRSVEAFEKRVLKGFGWKPEHGEVISPSFSHIFGGGYDAAYYGYQWAQGIEADAYDLFRRRGLYDRSAAVRLKELKEKGGSDHGAALYRKFRWRCPDLRHFLARTTEPGSVPANDIIPLESLYSRKCTAGAAVTARRMPRVRRRLHR